MRRSEGLRMSGYWTTMLIRWIDEFVLSTSIRDRFDGIRIANINYSADNGQAFTAFTKHALRLIEQKDPRRYRRVRREIRYIANVPLLSGAAYRRSVRCCEIDFDRYYVPPEDLAYEWQLARFAAIIVHEATHGHLFTLAIPYTEETWIRVERICHAEETRFLARLSGKHYDGK